ncbi:sporulation integral membrane protein YlbJ [Geosporobacter subterraneus DSM 17957]|uniref:Sporulation integral membrane protein YlbJ n=1 Tax=Geosporobacter subterraneus DSM 17957 TaxID=1121919 RepID=A0A1M6P1H5_9FIRM|nr:sporulation integral membrane protein YlbJ [Geosporobacter subterraneus]SHK01750.1 sporulation integral membrane protein YlbJ [Geosporobacter subterraneus DSM 17957]
MKLVALVIIFFIFYISKKLKIQQNINYALLVILVTAITICMIFYPKDAVEAARSGLDTWFNIVFPSLLPFFIGAELMVGLGVVSFMGILLEPIIHPLFNVPGEASFIFSMSITSGYPVGVKLTSKLREQGVISRIEAQRILSFCSTSGPLFLIGAVAVGMFQNPQLGATISIAHYLGAIATGLLFRFYYFNERDTTKKSVVKGYLTRALRKMSATYKNSNKSFGILMGEAVRNSIETMLAVGGFIIIFSVIIRIFQLTGIIQWLSHILSAPLSLLGLQQSLHPAFISGIFEITIGCKLASEIQNISFLQQAVFTTMIISWSGLSIHAQAVSLLSKTDISSNVYILSKLLHAILSSAMVFLVSPLVAAASKHILFPVFFIAPQTSRFQSWVHNLFFSFQLFFSITLTVFIIAFVLCWVYYVQENRLTIKK